MISHLVYSIFSCNIQTLYENAEMLYNSFFCTIMLKIEMNINTWCVQTWYNKMEIVEQLWNQLFPFPPTLITWFARGRLLIYVVSLMFGCKLGGRWKDTKRYGFNNCYISFKFSTLFLKMIPSDTSPSYWYSKIRLERKKGCMILHVFLCLL